MDEEDEIVCPVCYAGISESEHVVRVAADSAVGNGAGGYAPVEGSTMIFSIFHAECIIETMHNEDCDDIEFIDVAREMMSGSSLCGVCLSKITQEDEKPVRPILTLLRGGLGA